jgi:hypothetical protein
VISRILRTAGALALACSITACVPVPQAPLAASPSPAEANTATPLPASPPPVDTSAPAPAASPSSAATATVAPVTGVIYSQPPKSSGGLIQSSLRDPDGSATDWSIWDSFTLDQAQAIGEVRWRGGYDPRRSASGGKVHNFIVDIYPSIPAGTEPNIAGAPLVHYEVGGNAGETPAEVLGGVQTYDYRFTLPVPFQAAAGTRYWVQIEALQSGAPDWGLSVASGGDGSHYGGSGPSGEGYMFRFAPGDAAFTLLAPGS